MLTQTSYIVALGVYLLSALLGLVLLNYWFLRRASSALKVFFSFPVAALLLTPAYFEPGADTLAPALVVTAFQWLSQGADAAAHAVRPLMLFTGVALALGAVLSGLLWLRRRRALRADPALDLAEES